MTGSTVHRRAPLMTADLEGLLDLVDAAPAVTPHRLDAPWRLASLAPR